MKIQLTVTLTVERIDKDVQSESEFIKEDGKAMKKYLKERAIESFNGMWQYNAKVTNTKVSAI